MDQSILFSKDVYIYILYISSLMILWYVYIKSCINHKYHGNRDTKKYQSNIDICSCIRIFSIIWYVFKSQDAGTVDEEMYTSLNKRADKICLPVSRSAVVSAVFLFSLWVF